MDTWGVQGHHISIMMITLFWTNNKHNNYIFRLIKHH